MNLPAMTPYNEQAIDTVVNLINRAKTKLGIRQNLFQLARSREEFAASVKVSLRNLKQPMGRSFRQFLIRTVEMKWMLTPVLAYTLRYVGNSQDESAQFYYYEGVFSQPTVSYPIPQATVSVFFSIKDKHLEPPTVECIPEMTFRVEGQHTDHNVQYVALTIDWILAVLKMKINLFKKLEALGI